jgi:hypothetical protein
MTGIMESLVRGVRVVSDVANMTQVGSVPAWESTSVYFGRRLSLNQRLAKQWQGAWLNPVEAIDADTAATRAGRLEGSVGVLVRRGPANKRAGRAIRCGWPNAERGRPFSPGISRLATHVHASQSHDLGIAATRER